MSNKPTTLRVEIVLYLALIILAAWFRLYDLGGLPLSDAEATHALIAAEMTPHASPFWEASAGAAPQNPFYHTLTSGFFQLFGALDSTARLMSAIAGIAIVLVPFVARRRLGRMQALIMAALLAISPVLITTSRTAGAGSLAALGVFMAVALVIGSEAEGSLHKRLPWAAAGVGLALASGPSVLQGVLTIGIAVLLSRIFKTKFPPLDLQIDKARLRTALWIVMGTMVLAAGGLGFSTRGIAGLAEGLGTWVGGWGIPSRIPFLTSLIMVPVYEPILLVFGLISLVSAYREKDHIAQTAGMWAIGGLLVVAAYPSRASEHLIWAVIPMAYLAARALEKLVQSVGRRQSWLEFIGLTSLLITFAVFSSLQLTAYASGFGPFADQSDTTLRLMVILGIFFMAGVTVVFFGLGWNWQLAFESTGVAVFLVLLTFIISMIWRLNYVHPAGSAQDLWRPVASTSELHTMRRSIQSVSQAHTGRIEEIDVYVQSDIFPSLAWALRDFDQSRIEGSLEETAPSVVLVRAGDPEPSFNKEYIGQWMSLQESWDWPGVLPPSLTEWLVKREAPTNEEHWIFLVQAEIASLGEITVSTTEGEP
jgi:4-amino-4-deoxy-L-arabinose transferase-like glycosyltransferase